MTTEEEHFKKFASHRLQYTRRLQYTAVYSTELLILLDNSVSFFISVIDIAIAVNEKSKKVRFSFILWPFSRMINCSKISAAFQKV